MTYRVLEDVLVFGDGIPSLMEGGNEMRKQGWIPFGSPAPVNLTVEEYGMFQIMVRERTPPPTE